MFVLGVFRVTELPGGVLYRWEADGGKTAAGFALFESEGPAVRPCTETGVIQGDLLIFGPRLAVTGHDSFSDRVTVVRVAGAIVAKFLQLGEPPETAHKYYA
ncbi:hypothetical protein [Catellatospora chokoriensis]|uniref:Uncharacterized protein n=1 Tax=Catellatospora chokoriensis TaxID=310353 RepID=A0A8J3JZS8_9ACTN|nr:hypothetical protein [Catellatospora chokoriensis]GIF90256.1 hypothetical protein Cch02nite_37000 [Catellatospora chokoriensis]